MHAEAVACLVGQSAVSGVSQCTVSHPVHAEAVACLVGQSAVNGVSQWAVACLVGGSPTASDGFRRLPTAL